MNCCDAGRATASWPYQARSARRGRGDRGPAIVSTHAARLYDRHRPLLGRAVRACATREYFSPFPETPDRYPEATEALPRGIAAFEAQLNRPFELAQPGESGRLGDEISPYTGRPLGIDYPRADVDALFEAARRRSRRGVTRGPRLESASVSKSFTPVRQAASTGAGGHAHGGTERSDELCRQRHQCARRGIEAIVHAHQAMSAIAGDAVWSGDSARRRSGCASTTGWCRAGWQSVSPARHFRPGTHTRRCVRIWRRAMQSS